MSEESPTAKRHYDVVIVGGGVAGAVVAKVLAESAYRDHKSISLLILEAGTGAGLSAAGHESYLENYFRASIKTPNAPYPDSANARAPEDIPKLKPPWDRYYRQVGELPFGSNNTRALGGTTLHWMGIALRMMPNDFAMKQKYSTGEDWPIGYTDLNPYYEMAEWELGVSADRSDQLLIPRLSKADFRENYEFPMAGIPRSHLDTVLETAIGSDFEYELAGSRYPVRLVPLPQARNSMPRAEAIDPRNYLHESRRPKVYRPYGAPEDPTTGPGQRCQGFASCIPICPSRAKYTALKTIQQLRDMNRLSGISVEIVTRAVATDLQADDSGRITHVNYLRYEDEDLPCAMRHRISARRFVLAASAIENAKLLLASRNDQFPSGLANRSDCVGRYLMDHPFVLAWGRMPSGAVMGTFRGPGATCDLPIRDGAFREAHAAFRTDVSNWGWGLPDGAPGMDVERMIEPDPFRQSYDGKPQAKLLQSTALYGKELRSQLRSDVQRQITLGFLMEQLPEHGNRVTIDDGWKDQLGVHQPVIEYDISKYTRAGIAEAYRFSKAFFNKVGAEDFTDHEGLIGQKIEYEGKKFKYIGAGHIMGTHRMGSRADESVVNDYQRSWDHENLYVTGCGSMPTAGTSNPTLTAVALAIRSAEQIFRNLDLARL